MSKSVRFDERPVTVTLPARKLWVATSDDGGYVSGYCIVCGARGWAEDFRHKPGCELAKQLIASDLGKKS